jgi:hypothetical protein
MPRRVPDISRLRRLVGYEPRVQLNGIIESVIRYWEAEHSLPPVPGAVAPRRRARLAAIGERPRPVAAGA